MTKIMLIAGHGAGDCGAVGKYDGKTYCERDEARLVVAEVAARLKKANAEIIVRDPSRNAYTDYKAGKLALPKLDALIEIHFNALSASNKDGKTKGVECYIPASETKTGLADALCAAVSRAGLTNRGTKRYNWAVITAAKKNGVNAALLEVCFIDDPDDMSVYTTQFSAICEAIAQAIIVQLGLTVKKQMDAEVVQERAGLSDATMDYLRKYRWGGDLIKKLATAIRGY